MIAQSAKQTIGGGDFYARIINVSLLRNIELYIQETKRLPWQLLLLVFHICSSMSHYRCSIHTPVNLILIFPQDTAFCTRTGDGGNGDATLSIE